MKKIAVIGMGYVGIPVAALLADAGFDVIGIQRRSKRSGWKIDLINSGKSPIGGNEPGLEELIKKVVIKKKKFRVTDDISEIKDVDAVLIDVQTPTDENRIPQYKSLKEVSKNVRKYMKRGCLVIIESTVAPGTTQNIVKPILEEKSKLKAGKDFYLAFSYERVMVGRLLHNIINYPRIVGGFNKESTKKAMELYSKIVKAKLYPTDAMTAEVSKTVENTYRDVNIAFANEVAIICESLGINVYEVRNFVNTLPNDPSNPSANPVRNMHFPGAGVGGHCLPKDSWLLKYGLDKYGKYKFTPNVIIKSRLINDFMPYHLVNLIIEAFNQKEMAVKNKKICILGLAFLENSDDTRNTPTIPLYEKLLELGANVIVHDPFVDKYNGVNLSNNLEESIKNSDCLAIVTAHEKYKNTDLKKINNLMRTPIIVDGRNVFDKEKCEKVGFVYKGIGKS